MTYEPEVGEVEAKLLRAWARAVETGHFELASMISAALLGMHDPEPGWLPPEPPEDDDE
jgi:hypothetical protein